MLVVICTTPKGPIKNLVFGLVMSLAVLPCQAQGVGAVPQAVVLHAARMLDVANGKVITPGEVLVKGERIVDAGTHVGRPVGAKVIDLGETTLIPGLIDAHVHLFLHPRQTACAPECSP